MRRQGRDFNPLTRLKRVELTLLLHDRFTRQHKEELTRSVMKMSSFKRVWWHVLKDNANLRRFRKVPSVTILTPQVMFRILSTYDHTPSPNGLQRWCTQNAGKQHQPSSLDKTKTIATADGYIDWHETSFLHPSSSRCSHWPRPSSAGGQPEPAPHPFWQLPDHKSGNRSFRVPHHRFGCKPPPTALA
jgi:hypothetical protein